MRRIRQPAQNIEPILQKKMDKIVELQKGIKILRERMVNSKKDMIEYFDKNPQLKNAKYIVDDYTIHYVNRKVTDGISQKLIIAGLSQYFKSKGINDGGTEINKIMDIIKNGRQSKIVPTIDIRCKNESTEPDPEQELI